MRHARACLYINRALFERKTTAEMAVLGKTERDGAEGDKSGYINKRKLAVTLVI